MELSAGIIVWMKCAIWGANIAKLGTCYFATLYKTLSVRHLKNCFGICTVGSRVLSKANKSLWGRNLFTVSESGPRYIVHREALAEKDVVNFFLLFVNIWVLNTQLRSCMVNERGYCMGNFFNVVTNEKTTFLYSLSLKSARN